MTDAAKPKPQRPRKAPPITPQRPRNEQPTDAESYLAAVVAGQVPADPTRVRAALGLIRYQKAITRPPLASPPPRQLAARAARDAEAGVTTAFERRAAEIRAKHAAAKKKPAAA